MEASDDIWQPNIDELLDYEVPACTIHCAVQQAKMGGGYGPLAMPTNTWYKLPHKTAGCMCMDNTEHL